jgi:murein DD-endopeptidase MepM/ murein hydrolase activator NlpD
MDQKFRINFYPADASRVKEVAFPRRWGIIAAAILLPLAVLGFWLAFAGTLHESAQTRALRRKLAQENRALGDKVGKLDQDLQGLHSDLSHLEVQKVNALLISGMEYADGDQEKKGSSIFSFFRGQQNKTDIDASLGRAQAISSYLDSTLSLLGEKRSLVEGLPTTYPVAPEALVTREFGYSPDPFTGRKALHAGADFSLKNGAVIMAAGGGVVAEAGKDLLWGNYVKIDHGRGVQTFYAHLQDVYARPGQKVARGETIGTMGMTGIATGVHLHYELSIKGAKVDPLQYFLPNLVIATGRFGTDAAPDRDAPDEAHPDGGGAPSEGGGASGGG